MPEWKIEIRQQLENLRLAPAREAAIIEELSQHLDDCYADSLARGATPVEAARAALTELSDRQFLARELRRIEQQFPQDPIVLGHNRRNNMLADVLQRSEE